MKLRFSRRPGPSRQVDGRRRSRPGVKPEEKFAQKLNQY